MKAVFEIDPYAEWFRYDAVDYVISEFTEERQALHSEMRFVLPPFQRPYVWSRDQQVKFIQSIWGGLPIGSYVLNQTSLPDTPGDNWLLDGQQRWGAIHAYMRGEFEVYGDLFTSFDRIMQRRFTSRRFTCLMTRSTDLEEMERIYNLMAYGGTPHPPKAESIPTIGV